MKLPFRLFIDLTAELSITEKTNDNDDDEYKLHSGSSPQTHTEKDKRKLVCAQNIVHTQKNDMLPGNKAVVDIHYTARLWHNSHMLRC